MAKSQLRPTNYPSETVVGVNNGSLCHIGHACSTDVDGVKGDFVIMARTPEQLAKLFKKITGNEIDERGIHRVAIMKASAVSIDDDI